jgi:hypothetical protein
MAENINEMGAPFRYTLVPKTNSLLVFRTLPNATCRVFPEDSTDPKHIFKVYSDATGAVRLHARPSIESAGPIKLFMDCEAGDKVVRHSLEFRSSFEATADHPMPIDDPNSVPEGSRRPPLSEDEMTALTDDQLLERGYPLRPNRKEVPGAFRAWQRAVSIPMAVIEPNVISIPDVSHDASLIEEAPGTSSNWSGFVRPRTLLRTKLFLEHRGGELDEPYDWVQGTWNVPSVGGEVLVEAHCSIWVGLDGWAGLRDLVQAGTAGTGISYRVVEVDTGRPLGFLNLVSYYAWTQFLPQQNREQRITNFQVSPGDQIFTQVWLADLSKAPSLSGSFGQFLIMNLTTQQTARIYTPVSGTNVSGKQAVWITERPTQLFPATGIFGPSQGLYDLANYGSFVMYNAYARKAKSARGAGYVPYYDLLSIQLSMTNAIGDVLSSVTPIDSYSMRFDWHKFN